MLATDPARLSRPQLIERIYELEARIDAMRPDATADARGNLARTFRLTKKETALLMALADGRLHSKDSLLSMIYGGVDEPELKIIDVFVCKLRRKLEGVAIDIGTVWGQGYVIEDAEPLRAVMRGEPPRPADPDKPRIGKPIAAVCRPHGYVRDLALTFLRDNAVNGIARFTSREFEIAIEQRLAASTMLRQLEKRGRLTVLAKPVRKGSCVARAQWVVEVA